MTSDCKINLGQSKQLTRWVVLLIVFACFCTLYALPFFIALLALPLIILYGLNVLRQQCWRNTKEAVISIQRKSPTTWSLQTGTQGWLVRCHGRAFRSPWLIIATFQKLADKRNITVVITKDAVSMQHYTDLLAWLWI